MEQATGQAKLPIFADPGQCSSSRPWMHELNSSRMKKVK